MSFPEWQSSMAWLQDHATDAAKDGPAMVLRDRLARARDGGAIDGPPLAPQLEEQPAQAPAPAAQQPLATPPTAPKKAGPNATA